ncbi:hypothetical protein ACP4OV_016109 [Aristida adscensionis]
MADSAVSFVLGRLGEMVVKEAGVLREVGDDVALFRDKLQWLHTFVQHADHRRRRGGNAYMDVWVQQTREVAMAVEDVLDDFMLRANMEQGLPAWKKLLKFLLACATQVSVRHQLSARIAVIRARLDQISDHRNAYISGYSSSSATGAASPSISTLLDGWDEELEVIGFRKERLALEHLLLEGDKRRSIVLIVGESGIGKYSLAQMVFMSPVINRNFKARAMLRLPPTISESYALYWIHERLCPFDRTPATVEEIHSALSEHLKTRSYLIVVAGADKFFNWSSVLDTLPDNGLGSRVVIINNSLNHREVALAGPMVHELRVNHLDQKNSNLLFLRCALGSGNRQRNMPFGCELDLSGSDQYKEPQMGQTYKDLMGSEIMKIQTMGVACNDSLGSDVSERQIVQGYNLLGRSEHEKQMDKACKDMFEITRGLPLAILLLGRLLRRKEFPDQWGEVLKHLKSIKPSSRLDGLLAQSFDDLPHHLKSCFLYFAMVPQNMRYPAAALVRRWAAEGFLQHRKGEILEEVGHNYLKELISRGLVLLDSKEPSTSEGSTIRFVMIHPRVHAMAQFETQEGSFLDTYDSTDVLPSSSTAVRHLFIENLSPAVYTHMKDASFPNLRSIRCHFSGYWEQRRSTIIGATINSYQPYHGYALKHFGRSKLLRVIEIRGLQLKRLPHVIGSLIHLRYLFIESSCMVGLPSTIANLINLQTLDIHRAQRVESVTREFWAISALRHVFAAKLILPKSVGVLKNIQSLVGVVCVHPWHSNISPLHNMINLQHLEILGLTSHHWGALADAFKQLESLRHLGLGGHDIPFTLFTKFTLRRLQNLELHGRIIVSAEETEEQWTLPNLTRLELRFSMVSQGFINKIGRLPFLMELVLSDESFEGEELVFSQESGFGNLATLALFSLIDLREWKIGLDSLPKVKLIAVANCINMKLKLEGGQVLRNLEEFRVIDMPDNWGVVEAGALSEKFDRFTSGMQN